MAAALNDECAPAPVTGAVEKQVAQQPAHACPSCACAANERASERVAKDIAKDAAMRALAAEIEADTARFVAAMKPQLELLRAQGDAIKEIGEMTDTVYRRMWQ